MLFGVVAGGLAADAPVPVMLGILAVLVAIGATLYSLALGLAVLVFTYPFDLVTYAGPVKLTTSAILIVILLVVLLARLFRGSHWHWMSSDLDFPVLAFASATLLSLLGLAGYWEDQMVGLLKALGGFTMFFLTTQALRTRVDVWMVIGAILATASVQAATITYQVLSGSIVVSEDARAIGTVDNPNLFAGYLVLAIPLALAVGISFRSWWTTVATAIVTTSLIIALIATLSRSGWVGVLAGFIILAVLLSERRWTAVAVMTGVAAITAFVLFAPIAARLGPHIWGPGEMLSTRKDIWMVALTAGIHHPLFGVGVANFVNYYPQYGGMSQGINHAHSIFLNMFVERGIFGLLTFVAFLTCLFRSLAKGLRIGTASVDRAIVAGLIGCFGGYLVHALVEVSYYDYKVLLLFWVLAGAAGVSSRRTDDATADHPKLAAIPSAT